MAINLKFDLMGNPEPPSIVLANRNGNKLGQLNVDVESIDVKNLLKTSEFSFVLNKYIDGKLTNLWDKVVDFKLVYCPEWDLWYEIKVELDEATETIKTVFCTQLGQAELSQIKVYNTEINTESDIARDDYKISILYDENNKDASVFHRVMSKAPHYSIAYIDESLKRIQKSFSFDDSSICDVFDEIEEEVGCLVVYNSNSDKNGMPKRDISIYDLYQHCDDCGYREEFIGNECPKCHSKNIIDGYGEDTTIFVTADELATEGIQLVTDTDSVKNCFKLEAGDELMTATIRNSNPNGSDYIWYFSDAVKEDMSKELVEALESYDSKYKEYYNTRVSNLDTDLVNEYNALVDKYDEYYNTKSSCINCKHEDYFEDKCPLCHSNNILTGKRLQVIGESIVGYPDLMTAFYNTIDLALYLESGLMPSIETNETSAEEQLNLLTTSALSPVAVNVENINNVSLATANSAVLSMAKVLIRPTYKVEIKYSELSDNKQLWRGQFIVTNYSDETDTSANNDGEYINVTINNDTEEFIKQKIEKALNKENTDDLSISGLFNEENYSYAEFCDELKKYALNPLKSFYEACDACLSILTEQGAGNEDENPDLYESLYEPYYNRSLAIAEEIAIRENEIAIIEDLQINIGSIQSQIQTALNFENHLGEELWLEFSAYRRDDKYSNSNYVSDGLNNAELFEKANEFIKVAENEIFKSAELQHSISTTLNNLLSLPKFKPLLKSFKTGNWIRVQVDDRIFKLRLLEYNFNYGDLESIPVEFSDVIKIKNGTTDVQDVFSQAASMASSYDAVQRQAKKGDVARSTIDQWLTDGLNAANVQIQSNDTEEVLLTKNGLLARSYSDITGTYSPEQLKITHNIMAYTDDNWKTVRQSIGKHNYKYFDESEGKSVDTMGYGMNADFAIATVVSGSQIIGGDIYSNNYSKTLVDGETVTTGSYIDLENGYFSLAGGKLTYDGGDLTIVGEIEVTTSGRIGCWDINGTSIYKDSAAFGDADGMYFGVNGLSLGDDFKVEPSGLATMTNANVSGTITASDIIGGTITGTEIKGVDITAGSTLKVGEQKDEDGNVVGYNTWISEDGTLNADYANISGEIRAASGSIGGFNIKPNDVENDKTYGWLYSGESIGDDKSIFLSATDMSGTIIFPEFIEDENGDDIIDENNSQYFTRDDWRLTVGNNFGVVNDGTVYANNAILNDCAITGGSLKMGNDEDGYSAWISVEDGKLYAQGADIDGKITAIEGDISGWKITGDALYKTADTITSGICSIITPTSKGLLYETSEDDTFYILAGLGDCRDQNIIIPSVYEGLPVKSIKSFAFRNAIEITSVVIPNGITSIGNDSFANCTNLVEINIPKSIIDIGVRAFDNCSNLEFINIPDSVTTININAFRGCTKLTIYCESLNKPDGWNSNWSSATTSKPKSIIWGYTNFDHRGNVKYGENLYPSLSHFDSSVSTPRFYAGLKSNNIIPQFGDNVGFLVLEDGSLYASAAKISGEITATSGAIGNCSIAADGSITSSNGNFNVDSSGDLMASNVKISGEITATSGAIGNFDISNNALTTSKPMYLRGGEEAYIGLNTLSGGSSDSYQIGIEAWGADGKVHVRIFSDKNLLESATYQLRMRVVVYDVIGNPYTYTSTAKLTIPKGGMVSDWSHPWSDRWIGDTYYAGTFEANFTHLAGMYHDADRVQLKNLWDANETSPYKYQTNSGFTSFTMTQNTSSKIEIKGNLIPTQGNAENSGYSIGEDTNYWDNIVCHNLNQKSDRNLKNTINDLDEAYSELFDKLRPVTYKFNNGTSGRLHTGFIAQEVGDALVEVGIDSQDFAAYCDYKCEDGTHTYSLRYTEFIPLCVSEIQKLKRQVVELEEKIKSLE